MSYNCVGKVQMKLAHQSLFSQASPADAPAPASAAAAAAGVAPPLKLRQKQAAPTGNALQDHDWSAQRLNPTCPALAGRRGPEGLITVTAWARRVRVRAATEYQCLGGRLTLASEAQAQAGPLPIDIP